MILEDVFSDKVFYRKLWTLAFPITMQSFMLAMVAAADAIMLGRVDQDSMAAVSLATQIQFVQAMFVWAITSGVAILGAQYWGKNDKAVLGEIFGLSIRQSCVVSVLFWAGCLFCPELLMKMFAHDPRLIDFGASYLRVASWSYLIMGVSQCYLAIMKVSEHASRSAFISSGVVVINIVLNSVFIFGLCGAPAMGVRGAALATTLSRIIELIWCVASSYQRGFMTLEVRTVFRWNKALSADFWHCTLPLWGSYMFWGIGFTSFTAILGHLGSDAAAANSIQAVARDLMCCLCNGLAAGGGIIIGNELGAGKMEQGKIYGDKLMLISFMVGLLSTVIMLAVIPIVLHYMSLTDKAQSYLVGMFVIMSIYMIGRCVNTIVINGIFAAGGDTMFDFYSLAVCMWGLAIPCALISAFWLKWHVLVVFSCTCLDEVGKIPWVMHHYRKYKWVKNLTR